MGRVVHFEIHAENTKRAVDFYTNLFGWQFTKWDGPMEYGSSTPGRRRCRGINGGMVPRRGIIDGTAVIAYVCTVDVSNIDSSLI